MTMQLTDPPTRKPGLGTHDTAVSARRVSRVYGEGASAITALDDVSLDVIAGQFTVVMGPSGSGKSTLMHVLAGLDRPDDGSVWLGDDDIGRLGERGLTRLRRSEIAFIFQSFNLVPVLTARENVELPLRIAGNRNDSARVERLLSRVGLDERAGHLPSELSGGQQQRVAIARALVTTPSVLFADEPTGNLDSVSGREILALLRESVDEGQTIVMVTHDPAAAAKGDRVVFLADGRIAADLDHPTEAEVLDAMAEVSR